MNQVNNIFCIGRNYVEHIAELQNETPSEPLVFLKPNSSLNTSGCLKLPEFSQNIHFETELVLQIGKDCNKTTPEAAMQLISGYAVGLDLTARDVQDVAKTKGLPWTKAKGFKGAACISEFIAAERLIDVATIEFTLTLNGSLRQHGRTDLMIYPIGVLLAELAKTYGLRKGDLVYTGTPAGVGQLKVGDVLELSLQHGMINARFDVMA